MPLLRWHELTPDQKAYVVQRIERLRIQDAAEAATEAALAGRQQEALDLAGTFRALIRAAAKEHAPLKGAHDHA